MTLMHPEHLNRLQLHWFVLDELYQQLWICQFTESIMWHVGSAHD